MKELKIIAMNKAIGLMGIETIMIRKQLIKQNALSLYKFLKEIEGEMK